MLCIFDDPGVTGDSEPLKSEPTAARHRRRVRRGSLLLTAGVLVSTATGCGQADDDVAELKSSFGTFAGPVVATQHNDPGRTGRNLTETRLTRSLVGSSDFGKVYNRVIRGTVFAQPLYAPNRVISGVNRNVVYVATMHNMVYAFNADDANAKTPLWSRSLGSPVPLPDPEIGYPDYRDIWGEVGILSTPVIDTASNYMYLVAAHKQSGVYTHKLYQLNLLTGATVRSVTITAPKFDSRRQSQRSALLLQNGAVYITFGGYQDRVPYGGFVFAYRATDLALIRSHATAVTSSGDLAQGGVWMAGQGPAGDGSNIFYVTGNGDHAYDSANPLNQNALKLGQSVVKMTLAGTAPSSNFPVTGFFAPKNYFALSISDSDVGAAGVGLIPGTDYLVTGGKEGMFYVINRTGNLGYRTVDDAQIKQKFRVKDIPAACEGASLHIYLSHHCNHIHGSPVFFQDATALRMYVWAENDFIRSFTWNVTNQQFNCSNVGVGEVCQGSQVSSTAQHLNASIFDGNTFGMPGGMLSVSANGQNDGIIWGTHAAQAFDEDGQYPNDAEDASPNTSDGILVAYNSSTLNELWNSELNPRDEMGSFVKFNYPTISGGQVFTPTSAGVSSKVPVGGWPAGSAVTNKGPALATLGTGATQTLVYAWRNKSDGRIKVRSATDERTFAPANWSTATTTLAGITDYEPAMVGDGSKVYLAWTGTNSRINVISTTTANFATTTTLTQTTGSTVHTPLNELTNAGPALAYGGGRLFVAWKEWSLGLIRVMSSTDGLTFNTSTKVNLGEGSDNAPGLYYVNGTLYLVWVGPDRNLNVMKSTNNGASFGSKTVYTHQAGRGPSLIGLPTYTQSGLTTDLYMVYSNYDQLTARNLCFMTAEGSATNAFGFPHKMKNIETNERPATTIWRDRAYVAWTDLNERPMIGRWSPGELNVYGKLTP